MRKAALTSRGSILNKGRYHLITVTSASNEIGTLEPIKEIGRIARGKGVIFHTDAVACAGQIPLDVQELNVDPL